MTIRPHITCDYCGKPIEGAPDRMVNNFLHIEPGTAPTPGNPPMAPGQQNHLLAVMLDFHDFDCLMKWCEQNTYEHD